MPPTDVEAARRATREYPKAAARGVLRLAIIAMEFPSASETFVSGRVRTLKDLGVEIDIFSLRPEAVDAEHMAVAREVADVNRSSNSPASALRGLAVLAGRPRLTARYLRWLIAATRRKPDTLLRSLVLTPRAFDIYSRLARRPPEVVHAEWGHYPALVLWLVQAELPQVATSIALNAYDLTMEYGGSVAVVAKADLVRTHTRANIAHIARFTGIAPQRVELVYNGVDIAAVDAALRATKKVPGRVVTIARMIPEKRVDLVIEAFAVCSAAVPGAVLRVFGDGPERARLEAMVLRLGLSGRVEFFGHVDHDRVLRELAAAEAMLLLSETVDERLPNVVKEGMAAGCVCITTRSVGIEELVEHRVTGFVVEYGDVPAAAEALGSALNRREEANVMAAAARAHVETHFDHHSNVERFLQLWLNSRRR